MNMSPVVFFEDPTFQALHKALTPKDFDHIFKQACDLHQQDSEHVYLEFLLKGVAHPIPTDFFAKIQELSGDAIQDELSKLGYSIRIPNIHTFHPLFKQAVTKFFMTTGKVFSCNLYYTPSEKYDCLDLHVDPQQTYAYQWFGKKRWFFPLEADGKIREGSLPKEKKDLNFHEIIITPGDVLFVPIGIPHKASVVGDLPSVHINFGETVFTSYNFIQYFQDQLSIQLSEKLHQKINMYHEVRPGSQDLGTLVQGLRSYCENFDDQEFERNLLNDFDLKKLSHLKNGRNKRML